MEKEKEKQTSEVFGDYSSSEKFTGEDNIEEEQGFTTPMLDASDDSMDYDDANVDYTEVVPVMGFGVPSSPESSYNNPILGPEDEAREPPPLPPHIEHGLAHYPPSEDDQSTLPVPTNAVLNHLYVDNNKEHPFVALGITRRYLQKYVTVVLYKPKPSAYLKEGEHQ